MPKLVPLLFQPQVLCNRLTKTIQILRSVGKVNAPLYSTSSSVTTPLAIDGTILALGKPSFAVTFLGFGFGAGLSTKPGGLKACVSSLCSSVGFATAFFNFFCFRFCFASFTAAFLLFLGGDALDFVFEELCDCAEAPSETGLFLLVRWKSGKFGTEG